MWSIIYEDITLEMAYLGTSWLILNMLQRINQERTFETVFVRTSWFTINIHVIVGFDRSVNK